MDNFRSRSAQVLNFECATSRGVASAAPVLKQHDFEREYDPQNVQVERFSHKKATRPSKANSSTTPETLCALNLKCFNLSRQLR